VTLNTIKQTNKNQTYCDDCLNLQTWVPVPDNTNQKPSGNQIFEKERPNIHTFVFEF
jgi:hypothetical protein